MNVTTTTNSPRRRRTRIAVGTVIAAAGTTAAVVSAAGLPTVVGIITANHNETVLRPSDRRGHPGPAR